MDIQLHLPGTGDLLQHQFPDLPAEFDVIHQAVDLEVAMEAALIEVGRADDRPLGIDQHNLGMQDFTFHLEYLDSAPEQRSVGAAGKQQHDRDIAASRQQQSDQHAPAHSP